MQRILPAADTNPNGAQRLLRRPEAPKQSRPITRASLPRYFRQPGEAPAAIATWARIAADSMLSRQHDPGHRTAASKASTPGARRR